MLLNDLFEAGVDPRYLSAAERSRSQAQATQRQYWTSPEEKAAARHTELKREKGIAGYTKRHKAAHPEMYPKVIPRPAPKLRDPNTEYSDDYSVWAAGQRDTMEQGVAEGSEEGNLYAIAIQRYPQLKRVDRETVINALNSSYEDYLMHYGYEGIGPDEESSMIDHAVKGLKQGVAEGEYKSRHIHRQEQNKKYDEYCRSQEAAGKKPMSRGDWAATQRKGQKQGVAEGPMPPRPTPKWSPEQAIKRQHSRRELARAQLLKKKAEQPPTAGMSAAEKVDKGWRNPNM